VLVLDTLARQFSYNIPLTRVYIDNHIYVLLLKVTGIYVKLNGSVSMAYFFIVW